MCTLSGGRSFLHIHSPSHIFFLISGLLRHRISRHGQLQTPGIIIPFLLLFLFPVFPQIKQAFLFLYYCNFSHRHFLLFFPYRILLLILSHDNSCFLLYGIHFFRDSQALCILKNFGLQIDLSCRFILLVGFIDIFHQAFILIIHMFHQVFHQLIKSCIFRAIRDIYKIKFFLLQILIDMLRKPHDVTLFQKETGHFLPHSAHTPQKVHDPLSCNRLLLKKLCNILSGSNIIIEIGLSVYVSQTAGQQSFDPSPADHTILIFLFLRFPF